MFKQQLRLLSGSLVATFLVAGCSGGGSDSDSALGMPPADDAQTPGAVQSPGVEQPTGTGTTPPTNNAGFLFSQLQGSWSAGCMFFDDEEPDEGYARSELTITGNDFLINTQIFSDSNCVTPLPRGFLQFGDDVQVFGTIQRPDGSANTSVGAVPFLNINYERYTIENEPLDPAIAGFFPPSTEHTVVYIDGNQMFLGDDDIPGQDGESAATRSTTLDFEEPFIRQ